MIHYRRDNLASAIRAAKKASRTHPVYLFSTQGGFLIHVAAPPEGIECFHVLQGKVVYLGTNKAAADEARGRQRRKLG